METVWLVPLIPLFGFIILAIVGRFLSQGVTAWIGTGSVGFSALLACGLGYRFMSHPTPSTHVLWDWINVSGFQAHMGLYLDRLSVVMMVVVSVISFLILLYSTQFMNDDTGYSRFFAYMNLFVSSMLILVLADNLLAFFLGWEGVSLCSYLLIGFWYQEEANVRAANKAFLITRIGDAFLVIGLVALFWQFGTLQLPQLLQMAETMWPTGSAMASAITLLLLAGAISKSAQLPLQTWLPDAMAGPTPVSALIHAATMVTAGVYLIARTHVLFALAPQVQLLVAILGCATLLLAGCSALAQHDIKKVLAYSTMSQIGYMFLALGVGAWDLAIFHFMAHAFFKSLLFLCAGVVILAMNREHDMFKMGGLRQKMPLTFWCFLIGSIALSALPWIDAGFYTKDPILSQAYFAPIGGFWLWLAGVIGAFITPLYTFRMVLVTFFGPSQQKVVFRPDLRMLIPMVLLGVASLFGGLINIPHFLGIPSSLELPHLQLISSLTTLLGFGCALLLFGFRPRVSCQKLQTWVFGGWGFDWLYEKVFVRPFLSLLQWNQADCFDLPYTWTASLSCLCSKGLSRLQTGKVRWYAMTVAIGAILVISLMVWP